jgi:hypothetical protein
MITPCLGSHIATHFPCEPKSSFVRKHFDSTATSIIDLHSGSPVTREQHNAFYSVTRCLITLAVPLLEWYSSRWSLVIRFYKSDEDQVPGERRSYPWCNTMLGNLKTVKDISQGSRSREAESRHARFPPSYGIHWQNCAFDTLHIDHRGLGHALPSDVNSIFIHFS